MGRDGLDFGVYEHTIHQRKKDALEWVDLDKITFEEFKKEWSKEFLEEWERIEACENYFLDNGCTWYGKCFGIDVLNSDSNLGSIQLQYTGDDYYKLLDYRVP